MRRLSPAGSRRAGSTVAEVSRLIRRRPERAAAAARHVEVEAKLLVSGEGDLRAIGRLTQLGPHHLRRRRTLHLYSVYLDTPELALLRGGVALRLRRQGRRWEVTAKWRGRVIGAVHNRPELTVPLSSPPRQPFRLPVGPLRAPLAAIIADRPLWPILRTEIRRQRRDVCRLGTTQGLRPVAELALDRVRVGAPDGSGTDLSYCEVEIECRDGTRRDILALARWLRKMVQLKVSTGSKFSRGIALLYGKRGPARHLGRRYSDLIPAATEQPLRRRSRHLG